MHRKSPKPFTFSRVLLILSMASLLTVSLLLLFLFNPSSSSTALRRRHQHRIPTADATDPPPQIREACKATRFPDSCLSALSQSPDPTPTHLILAAISASSAALATARSLSQSILDSSASDPDRSTAARNCLEHLSLSDRRLSAASVALPRVRVKDARAWTGAALLYQYDCWSALKYVNGTRRVADAMSFLTSLTALTSNALSMIAAYQRFGADTARWSPPQTERDGYWGDDDAGAGGPLRSAAGALPSDLSPDVSVCKTGGCDHRTVQEAVDAAPDYGSDRFVIYIKAGTYEETVRISFEKTNLVFLGDGMGRTVITSSLNAQMTGVSTYNTATVGVSGDGFMARDLTFENTAGPGAHQAVAFRSDSDLSILESVEFSGHQDTLYARSLRQLYRSCRISGTVDFIFGNSATVFQDCLILVVPRLGSPEKGETNAVTAQGRTDPAQATGFVFHNSAVNATDEYMALYRSRAGRHKVYLGRPWKEYSRTVFVGCYLGVMVRPEGWLPWRGEFALATLFYGEFGSSGPGSNPTARVGWSSQIPAEHVAAYSVQNFIQGDEWIPSNQ